MRILYSPFFIFMALVGLGSCNTARYMVDYDKNVNFYRYSTYNFTPSADSIPMNQLNKTRLFNALSQVMNENDIRWSAEPELYLHVHVMMKGSTDYNIAYGDGETLELGSGFSMTYVDRSIYSEGTLFFDLIDVNRQQLIWTTSITETIKDNSPFTEKEITRIVRKAFRKFPPRPPR